MAASRHCIGFADGSLYRLAMLRSVQFIECRISIQSIKQRHIVHFECVFFFAVHATARREKNHFMHEANGEFKMDKFSI